MKFLIGISAVMNYSRCYLQFFNSIIIISVLFPLIIQPEQLKKAKEYLKDIEDKTTYFKYKEAIRVLRKAKYN